VKNPVNPDEDEENQDSPAAVRLYHTLQCLCYAAMAAMIMRLKLFWTPQLCVMAALLASSNVI
jgi:hypothetical protein